jgi:two-component system, sensor histidine kinase and response regulator
MDFVLTSDATASVAGQEPSTPSRRLLIVDDDASVREALLMTFRHVYDVAAAENGPMALKSFANRPADVALLDLRMPGMDGMEVLKHLRKADPDVEVVILTAFESLESVREAMHLGASDYLAKPFSVERLREAVHTAMDRREVSRKIANYDRRLAHLQEEMHHQQIREELARTRNEIYASIIHDINGPLTVIASYIGILQADLKRAHSLEGSALNSVRESAASIQRQVSNCVELSRRYLSFLEGQVSAQAHVGVREILYDLAELLRTHPSARKNDLVFHPLEHDASASMHPTDLLQVLLNITINALQCTPSRHKVEVYAKTLRTPPPANFTQGDTAGRLIAAEGAEAHAAWLAISIKDNGPGIAASAMDRIFEPHFSTKAPGQGSGLGLSIVRRLVFQARGAVHVYSHLGEGSVFTVYVPLASTPD